MKKLFAFVCFVLLFSFHALAQGHKEKIRLTAQLMVDATIKEDYSTVLDYTYSKLLEVHGGKDSVLYVIKEGLKKMKDQGMEFVIVNAIIGDPGNEIKLGTMLYSIVPESLVIKVNGKKYSTTGSLIGISSNNGDNWTFVDTAGLEDLKKLLPDVNKLSIPASTGPTLMKDN
ncbi:MAG TPA: hypothetical protein VK671_15565 [Mucilaginibacter sp.]|jgi:hypothetical protein|nr:hypothetical protein [Mucilaginibacter sp.]